MRLSIDGQVLADQIGFARVVDVPSLAPVESSVDYVVLVESEIVAVADTQFVVVVFSLVGDGLADLLPHVLNDYVLWVQSTVGTIELVTLSLD